MNLGMSAELPIVVAYTVGLTNLALHRPALFVVAYAGYLLFRTTGFSAIVRMIPIWICCGLFLLLVVSHSSPLHECSSSGCGIPVFILMLGLPMLVGEIVSRSLGLARVSSQKQFFGEVLGIVLMLAVIFGTGQFYIQIFN